MRLSKIFIAALAVAVATASCSDATSPAAHKGLRFVSGFDVSDTVDASVSDALVVEVYDTLGHLASKGTVVRFTAIQTAGFSYEAGVQNLASPFVSNFASSETDDAGRAGILVRMGQVAGKARIAIAVPILGLDDTARYTVLPGAAVRAVVTPTDTALYTSGSYKLRGGVVDRYGNPRSDATTWTASDPGISVTSAGVVTGSAIGRYTITAASAVGSATGSVTVVPKFRLAGWRAYPDGRILSLELDGSGLSTRSPVVDGGIGAHPAWMPDGKSIIYTTYDGTNQALRVVGDDGVVKAFF